MSRKAATWGVCTMLSGPLGYRARTFMKAVGRHGQGGKSVAIREIKWRGFYIELYFNF